MPDQWLFFYSKKSEKIIFLMFLIFLNIIEEKIEKIRRKNLVRYELIHYKINNKDKQTNINNKKMSSALSQLNKPKYQTIIPQAISK